MHEWLQTVHLTTIDFSLCSPVQIFMDLNMPVMGGNEATNLIRQMEKERGHTPSVIVALTANVRDVMCEGIFDKVLSKPLSRERLKRILNYIYQVRSGAVEEQRRAQ